MADGPLARGRHAGVLVPLFAIPTASSWGIGEIPDLARFAGWMSLAGLDFVQLLPVNEMEEGQSSPYSALSAMAIDPIFIAVGEMADFEAAGGIGALDAQDRSVLEAARASRRVEYSAIRPVKTRALRKAFARFVADEWTAGSPRAMRFREFLRRERWWLDDYGLFRALHDEHAGRYWLEWEPALRDRTPDALAAARARLEGPILYYEYLQWIADDQWRDARAGCAPAAIVGDFPFMVSGHSADVWARQHEFRLDASVGVPPDAFSATGQNWGLPVYRWDVIARGGYEWLRQRSRRCAELYDAFRVDHLVGFYRTFVREPDDTTYFVPADEDAQRAQGETLLEVLGDGGAAIIAEDLGVIPDFVRESLARLNVPGLKVLRWEREWTQEGQPFRDPAGYPARSVAVSGTHDTETCADWWEAADADERTAVATIPAVARMGCRADRHYGADTRDALLAALYHSGSDFVLLAMQDIFGWRDRINTPASVGEQNWTWRLPIAADRLRSDPVARERAAFLRDLADASGRGPR